MKLLYNYLEQFHPISETLKQFMESGVIQHQLYPSGTTLLAEGAIATKLYFIKKGLCRFYYYLNEKEITSLFIKEGEALIAYKSFFEQNSSPYIIETLEPTLLLSIDYKDFQHAYAAFQEVKIFIHSIESEYNNKFQQRAHALSYKDAEESYNYFQQQFRDLEKRLNLYHIASYLAISDRTLRRVRDSRDRNK